jgi:hypothetical protein
MVISANAPTLPGVAEAGSHAMGSRRQIGPRKDLAWSLGDQN